MPHKAEIGVYAVYEVFRKRKALSRAAKNGTPPPAEEPQQGKEVDSGLVAYSEMRYLGIPDPERVVADIRSYRRKPGAYHIPVLAA